MATTYRISPETARRALGMINLHKGDIARARYDVGLVLRSLGTYTDIGSSKVHDLLTRLQTLEAKHPETCARWLEQLPIIAAGATTTP